MVAQSPNRLQYENFPNRRIGYSFLSYNTFLSFKLFQFNIYSENHMLIKIFSL